MAVAWLKCRRECACGLDTDHSSDDTHLLCKHDVLLLLQAALLQQLGVRLGVGETCVIDERRIRVNYCGGAALAAEARNHLAELEDELSDLVVLLNLVPGTIVDALARAVVQQARRKASRAW